MCSAVHTKDYYSVKLGVEKTLVNTKYMKNVYESLHDAAQATRILNKCVRPVLNLCC